MATQVFINLPVSDLGRSMEFFSKLGYTFNEQFTDDKAACMVISEHIYTMLLREEFFKTFTNKTVTDARKSTESIIALSAENREQVDDIVDRALLAGGTSPMPVQDHGWMYGRGFTDLDGHMWEVIYMDPEGPAE